jgi:hypothetical protein
MAPRLKETTRNAEGKGEARHHGDEVRRIIEQN